MNNAEPLLKAGITGKKIITVNQNNTAARYGSGLIEVFATPAMIGLMEATAQESVMPFLKEGYITLGTEVNVKHVKATPVGMDVECLSELIEVDDRKLVFSVKAYDNDGEIGNGTHTRFIVNSEKFMRKLTKKQ